MRERDEVQSELLSAIRKLTAEFAPLDVEYFDDVGSEIVEDLVRGRDVRITFNQTRIQGDSGALGHEIVETIRCLLLAWSVYKAYGELKSAIARPSPSAGSLREAIVAELMTRGILQKEAGNIADSAVAAAVKIISL